MIPSDIKFDGNATPPQFTDNADQVIERGTHIRVKIKGIRGEVGQMYAIATIKEDYLGYVLLLIGMPAPLHNTNDTALCSRPELDHKTRTVDERMYDMNKANDSTRTRATRAQRDGAFAWRCEEQGEVQSKSIGISGRYPSCGRTESCFGLDCMYSLKNRACMLISLVSRASASSTQCGELLVWGQRGLGIPEPPAPTSTNPFMLQRQVAIHSTTLRVR